jgi:hypothetical protein
MCILMRPPRSQHLDLEVIYKTSARPLSAFLFVTFKICLVEALARPYLYLHYALQDRPFSRCGQIGSMSDHTSHI